MGDRIGGHCTGVGRTAKGLGDKELAPLAQGEPKRGGTHRSMDGGISGPTIASNGIRDEAIGVLFRHHEDRPIRGKGNLCGSRDCLAQWSHGVSQRPQGSIRLHPEAGDVVNLPNVPTSMQDKQQVIV